MPSGHALAATSRAAEAWPNSLAENVLKLRAGRPATFSTAWRRCVALPRRQARTGGRRSGRSAASGRPDQVVHGTQTFSRILPDLVAEMARNPELGKIVDGMIGRLRRERALVMLQRAIERGELGPDTDLEFALDLFAAPIYWRLTIRAGHTEPEYLDKTGRIDLSTARQVDLAMTLPDTLRANGFRLRRHEPALRGHRVYNGVQYW